MRSFISLFSFPINTQKKPKLINKNGLDNKTISDNNNKEQNHKLYNSSENPFFSIIFDIENLHIFKGNILNNISIFSEGAFKDIELILLFYSYYSICKKNISEEFNILLKKRQYYNSPHKKKIDKIFEIINNLKGKYLIFIDNYIGLQNIDIFKIFNITKGNNASIFKYYINKKFYLHIIRTKILRDIIDTKIQVQNFNDLIKYIYSYKTPKLNYIPIAFCADNKYSSLTYTSMLSILCNKDYYTYIIFFVVIPRDFLKRNIKLLKTLYEQYDYFNISFIEMDDRYKNAYIDYYITVHAFFRFSLGELIPNINKIIYLDSDTICFTDLTNLYNLNFKGKIILGQVLSKNKSHKTGNYSINSGVLLLDLSEMRKIQMEKKVLNIIHSGEKILDQEILNKYFSNYLGLFPPKYNTYLFAYNALIKFNEGSGSLYDNDYLYFSFRFPSIRHFVGSKTNLYKLGEWSYFAKKSKYFNKLSNNYSDIFNISLR